MYKPTAKGYCSGGGLMELGFVQAGVELIQSLEIDPIGTSIMRNNHKYFPYDIRTEDMTKITVLNQPKSDISIFTYPCTKYSAIADIHGTRTGDDLFLHAFRHFAIEQNEMVVAENVPGMKKFPVVMEAMTKLPGYHFQVLEICASIWVPQKRKRLIIIGTKRSFEITLPEKIAGGITMKDIIEDDPCYDMPDYVVSRINGKYRDKPIVVNPDDPAAMAPTCVAHYAKDLGTRLVMDSKAKHGVRPFTVREYARLQGVPDDYEFNTGSKNAYRIIGNGVAVPMGKWCGEQAMKYFN